MPHSTVWITINIQNGGSYVLPIRLTVTCFYVPFVPCWQGHAWLNLNVNWLDCHICRQLYCHPWDEQRYLSYRHVLVSLLTPIGGEALSRWGFVALCCQGRYPDRAVRNCNSKDAIMPGKLSYFCAFYSRPTVPGGQENRALTILYCSLFSSFFVKVKGTYWF